MNHSSYLLNHFGDPINYQDSQLPSGHYWDGMGQSHRSSCPLVPPATFIIQDRVGFHIKHWQAQYQSQLLALLDPAD